MEQAGELAATTAKLLNVSEFTSVDEATSALVSSLQAFTTEGQDVGQRAEEIVDILNHIGNRYPVATNELADGLATSSAALVAANNSIEEQVALLSAGNATMQDISTVASGLKIVAARLRGTTTDIDDDADSAITNVSKLQSKIKALTAEANGGEGIDIINEKGEYKSTYEILTEISKIFDKMDDVSSASLLELIAGKNRSSVVAAILQNGDILEEAYADAFNADSSAQNELDNYLDSIQGRIDLFNNSVQTMWMNFIDAEAVKFIVNLGTGLIKLVDNVGLLETALAGVLTYFNLSSKSKLDFASMFGIHDIKNGWFANIKTQAEEATDATKSLSSALKQIQNIPLEIGTDVEMAKQVDLLNQKWSEGQESFVNYVSTLGDADIALKAYAASVKDGNYSLAGFQDFIKQHNDGIEASGVKAKAAAVGHQLLNAAISMGISLLISGAISVITKWVNANEEAAEAMRDAANEAKDLSSSIKDIEEYSDQIVNLRKNLQQLNLTEEEAYRYKEDLLHIQDSLIERYGKEASGINLVTGAVEDQIAALRELAKAEYDAYVREHTDEITNATDFFKSKDYDIYSHWFAKTWDTLSLNDMGESMLGFVTDKNQNKIAEEFIDTFIEEASKVNGISFLDGADGGAFTTFSDIQISGTPDEQLEAWNQIYNIITNIGRDMFGSNYMNQVSDALGHVSDRINDITTQIESNRVVFDKYVEGLLLYDAQYSSFYSSLLAAQQEYDNVVLNGTPEEINAARQKVIDLQNSLGLGSATPKFDNDAINLYFETFFDEWNKIAQQNQLDVDIKLNTDNIENNLKDAVANFSDDLSILNTAEHTDEQKLQYEVLASYADKYGLSIDQLVSKLVALGYVQGNVFNSLQNEEFLGKTSKTYSAIVESIESYNEVFSQTSEIVSDNTEVTEEYKDSLIALGISEEEINECFDENNKLVVKDARALNNLVKSAKKNTAQNIRLAKSQARLEYYELYKEMKELTNGTEVVDAATLSYINSLYDQMTALQRTIAKYSLLEAELLGAANAYQELADAQAADEAMDYGSKAEELVNVLAEAFNTAQLGTEAARVAIEGLIPDDVIDKSKTLDEQMQQVYDYFTKGEVSQLFTIEFDDEGAIQSVEMTKKNVEKFTESLIGTDDDAIFQGTWDEFTLNPAIKNLDDFADKIGTTKEVAFAYLTELEKYDIGNALGFGGDTLLDQLMGDNLDYQLQKAIETAAEVEKKLAEGTIKADSQEYQDAQKNLEAYEEQAIENVTAWSKQQQTLEKQKDLLKEYQKEYEKAVEDQDTSKIEEFEGKIKDTSKEIDTLIDGLIELDEPTEFVLEVAMSEAKENIAEFKEDIDELVKSGDEKAIKINSFVEKIDTTGLEGLESLGFVKGPDGIWRGTANIEGWSELDPASKQKVLEYINMLEGEHQIDVLMGEGTVSVEEQLSTIAKILADIAKILDPTYTLSVETSEAEQKATTFKSIWDGIQSKAVTLTKNVVETVTSFFTRTPKDGDGTSVNGTAHMSGTANAGGSWGAPKTETSLVGELGPEILVRGNRWTTVGDNGAEFTQVKKGDIIFNHKQTEELLKNGHVTGRGKAYAGGTAYAMASDVKRVGGGIDTWDHAYKTVYNNYSNATIIEGGANVNTNGNNYDPDKDYSNNGDDVEDIFEETFDWIEVRLEEINEELNLKGAQLENAVGYIDQNSIIDKMIGINETLHKTLTDAATKYTNYANDKILPKINEKYHDMIKDGAMSIEEFIDAAGSDVSEEQLNAIQEYREWIQKGADATQQAEEVVTEIQSLAKKAFDNIATEFKNKLSIHDSKISQFEANNSLLETDKGFASESIYEAIKAENQAKIDILNQQRDALQAELNIGKIKKYSDAWYDAVNTIAECDNEIINLNADIEDLQDSINELHWEKFDLLIKQFQAVSDEAENLLDILATKDVVDEFGNWTDEGVASLGLLAQQMEEAEMAASKYEKEIEYLNKNWKSLGYTQEEYVDKLDELKSGQYDAINSYHDAKDAIIDLNKARVDAIKDGIEKEIEAYEKLIDAKKEELDAEKDLHDFQKGVMEQQKDISEIERKLAALSGDNSASARAQRAKLEAELAEAQAALEEIYYDRSIENQQNALDKELENFQEQKDAEIEGWEKYLENVELVVADSLAMVQENTRLVYAMLTSLAQQYGLDITSALTNPWLAGETAIQDYGAKLNVSLTTLAAMFGLTVDEFAAKLGLTTEMLVSNLDITVAQMAENLELTNEQLAEKLGLTVTDLNAMMGLTIQELAANMGITLPVLAEKLGTTTAGLVGNLDMTMAQFAGRMGLTVEGLAGKFGLSAESLADKLGMTYQDLMNPFGLAMSATVDALKKLEDDYKGILEDISDESKQTVKDVNNAMDKYHNMVDEQSKPSSSQPGSTQSTPGTSNTTPDRSEKDYYGVALAIWNGNHGWGTGRTRMNRLTNKGFDANKVQDIVNKLGEEGYIHSGAWIGRYYGIKDLASYNFNKYAKGSTGVKKSGIANVDELGEELIVRVQNGRLTYLEKGSGVVPADLTSNLMKWGKLDPSIMLDQNRPAITAPHIVNNEINIDCSVGTMVNIEHCDQNTLPDVEKIVNKAFDKHMQTLNNSIRKYTR